MVEHRSQTTLEALGAGLPPPWPHALAGAIAEARAGLRRKVVVLDDDPTGTQTVHGVPVLTEWPLERLSAELGGDAAAFYLLTNSRSLPPQAAAALCREIGRNLRAATELVGVSATLVSRSDSTLRGHYPQETDALTATFLPNPDALLLIPAFLEGGRYTANDVHYAEETGALVPVAETAFAQDASFGYRNSELRLWVEEKTAGRVRAADVASLPLPMIREGGPEAVLRHLRTLPRGAVCVVNALCQRDLEVVALAVSWAESAGGGYLFRSAASFVPVLAGISSRPLLGNDAFAASSGHEMGGLVVVGSYVPRTTRQLEVLLEQSEISPVELNVGRLLSGGARAEEEGACRRLNALLGQGRDAVLFTSRGLVAGADALGVNRRVSASLVAVVRGLSGRPKFLIAKGGVTSSDLATRALGVTRALVLGQLLPGVPVWRLGAETPYPGLPYVIFPGNVGDERALYDAYAAVRGPR